ncbi:MAG: hypothetical protein IKI65_05485 [Firmicutes bacterium]|nr:hypothetical protein [Bacillota bacterium]
MKQGLVNVLGRVLTVFFALVISALLLYITCITVQPRIDERAEAELNISRMQVLPDAEELVKMEDIELIEGVRDIYSAADGSGYVVTVDKRTEFGNICVMIGLDPNGAVRLAKVVDRGGGRPSEEGAQSYAYYYTAASQAHFGSAARARRLVEQLDETSYTASDVLSAIATSKAQLDIIGGDL